MARQGWLGVTIDPAGMAGMGGGHLAKTVMIEEFTRVSGAMGAAFQALQLGASLIIDHGTEEQKQRWLPGVAEGTCLPTIAVTEPESGSDVLGIHATARRDGEHYILSGHKNFVGSVTIGTLHGVVARTGEGSRGLSAFLVESDMPGVSLPPHQPLIGFHGFSADELVLDNVRVPASHRLGAEGDGYKIASTASIGYGRLNLGAVALGLHQAIMDETVRFVQAHQRYGGPIARTLDTVLHNVGRIREGLLTSRLLLYTAAHLLDHGQATDEHLMAAKYRAVDNATEAGRIAMEIQAGHGLRGLLPRLVQDTSCTWAPAGTGDVHRLRFGQKALGIHAHDNWSQHTLSPLTDIPRNNAPRARAGARTKRQQDAIEIRSV